MSEKVKAIAKIEFSDMKLGVVEKDQEFDIEADKFEVWKKRGLCRAADETSEKSASKPKAKTKAKAKAKTNTEKSDSE